MSIGAIHFVGYLAAGAPGRQGERGYDPPSNLTRYPVLKFFDQLRLPAVDTDSTGAGA
jgi:hypothetical protein